MKLVKNAFIFTAAASAIALAPLATAYEAGDVALRLGVTQVAPDASSDNVTLDGSTLSLAGGTSQVDVDSNTQLGLTLEYFVTDAIGVELLAATPFEHTAEGKGELAGLDITDAKQLPPTLSLVYHFGGLGQIEPYVGVGLNYTVFFDEDITGQADTTLSSLGLTGADVSLEESFGYAVQAGVDFHLDEKWFINASVRYIDISTTADIDFDNGSTISVDVDIDPFVYSLFAGYRF
ncbi:OmpW/AlkL family protein [Halioxenophilus aromaticivorans]|uniref:Outer membrane beta-barrel protein n=1 Tax=Halioxenophilus aromaticivorans TaxID=1306992 RepID=A0AAV3U1Q3_9ALTE